MCEEHESGAGVGRRPLLAMLGLGAVTTACGSSAGDDQRRASAPTTAGTTPGGKGGSSEGAAPAADPDMAVDPPGELEGALRSSDFLVYGKGPLEKGAVEKMLDISGVQQVEPIALASFYVDDAQVTYAAVDPGTFRRFTMAGTAQTQAVWDRVAGGEIAVEPKMGRKLQSKDGFIEIGNESDSQRIHIGAYAGLLPETVARRIDAVVNLKWGEELGMKLGNAALVGLGSTSPQKVRKKLQAAAGDGASILILGPDLDINAKQTVVLSGGSAAQAIGSFSYRANSDGTVAPDPRWVAANIRTETMPIIGRVTGHRVMLPQLKGALEEIVTQGLSSKIYTYDGCYVPRFIGRDPSRGLSFHTYGTAIDLNAADNYRGIAGAMDRQVVTIFKRWGFAWGGDWNYTDPMHFELSKIKEN
ncbi:M15 family metallopeptidase [Nocardioides aurantiacus]|uniref:D-alanyl-D-alanine carboxypeptidase-like protein n=1 Tax=Nocardioides aurantiacus TaxID=86796 RepID=A0A3N2D0J5_9ACTN|nr:M15 family metallopeptidase [Nocardioides aurantiacus]ROR92974.1 D-alanyl-D-alanine carboxypeptidase-like protein [Nocardioides aurantiacus]